VSSKRPDRLPSEGVALDAHDVVRLVEAAAQMVAASFTTLDELDAVVGDGDHGVNLQQALAQAVEDVHALSAPTPGQVLAALGNTCRERMAGAAGTLFGAFFGAMADALSDRTDVDSTAISAALTAGAARVGHLGGARVGDKTMLDALVPAASAAREAALSGSSVADTLARVAEAASAGAAATRQLQARLGRARYVGDKSIGVADPGATSISMILSAWAHAAAEPGGPYQRPEEPRMGEVEAVTTEGGGR
jgi:dihydroxyacetone kinase-like protein